jgi:hypothetical protein
MRKYVIYQTTNKINGKTYIGFHGVSSEEPVQDYCDGGSIFRHPYFGTGRLILRALAKYKHEDFTQRMLFVFDNQIDAETKERELVDRQFTLREDTYNLALGGGGCADIYARVKRGGAVKTWIQENPEKHMERMLKINKNPEKIRKMAEKHRGMKRSEEACRNISNSLLGKPSHAKGRTMAFDPDAEDRKTRYFDSPEQVPEGWVVGNANRGKGRGKLYTNGTGYRVFPEDSIIPEGWVRGAPSKNKKTKPVHAGKIVAYDPNNKDTKHGAFDSVDDIPDGWVRGRRKTQKCQT